LLKKFGQIINDDDDDDDDDADEILELYAGEYKMCKKNIQPTRRPCGILCNRHIKVSSLLVGTCSKLHLKLNVRYFPIIRGAILNTFIIRSF